jgi:hypothetical protein
MLTIVGFSPILGRGGGKCVIYKQWSNIEQCIHCPLNLMKDKGQNLALEVLMIVS